MKLIITPELMNEINNPAPANKPEEAKPTGKKPRGRPPKNKLNQTEVSHQPEIEFVPDPEPEPIEVSESVPEPTPSLLLKLHTIAKELNTSDDESQYESIASDNDIAQFVDRIQCLRLWLDLRDYVDDVYGEECVYLEWSYQPIDGLRMVDIVAYDADEWRIEVSPRAVLSEVRWLQEINTDMLYAYRIRYWVRKEMNLLKYK